MKTADAIYARLVAREGLYAIAFFGHRGTKTQYRRLRTLWRAARREAGIA